MQAVRTVGDLARITLTVYDIDGNEADASSVTAIVTDPNGDAETQQVQQAGLGSYYFDYPVTIAGRHSVYWQTTGLNTGATTDAFDAQATIPVATAAELKRHLNVEDYADDTELLMFLDYATTLIEQRVGKLTTRTVTATLSGDGGSELALPQWPIASVTSVTENGSTVDSTRYAVHPVYRNCLVKKSGYLADRWWPGFANIEVTYTAGYTDIPANYRLAVLELTKHLFKSQRGTARRGQAQDDYQPGATFALPYKVLELIDAGSPGLA